MAHRVVSRIVLFIYLLCVCIKTNLGAVWSTVSRCSSHQRLLWQRSSVRYGFRRTQCSWSCKTMPTCIANITRSRHNAYIQATVCSSHSSECVARVRWIWTIIIWSSCRDSTARRCADCTYRTTRRAVVKLYNGHTLGSEIARVIARRTPSICSFRAAVSASLYVHLVAMATRCPQVQHTPACHLSRISSVQFYTQNVQLWKKLFSSGQNVCSWKTETLKCNLYTQWG